MIQAMWDRMRARDARSTGGACGTRGVLLGDEDLDRRLVNSVVLLGLLGLLGSER